MPKRSLPDDYPRRPISAFLRYVNANRDRLKHLSVENGPNVIIQVTKLAKEEWTALPSDEKSVYTEEYSSALNEYKIKVAEYKSKTQPPPSKKVKKDVPKKRAPSSYILFATASRSVAISELSVEGTLPTFSAISKRLSEKWKRIGDEEKMEWKKKSDALFQIVKSIKTMAEETSECEDAPDCEKESETVDD